MAQKIKKGDTVQVISGRDKVKEEKLYKFSQRNRRFLSEE